jgi:hypothetical protein
MTRRLAIALAVSSLVSSAVAQQPFTIVALPDTQNYCRLNATSVGGPNDFFLTQTQWVVNNAAQQNIVFATQLGDVVNDASTPLGANPGSPNAQWNVAVNAMNVLKNSTVPHSILPGNHDWTSSNGTGNLVHYRPRFGDTSTYFAGKPWFRGFDPTRGANSAQRFSTPVGDMLHLALEWNAFDPAVSSDRPSATGNSLAWAQSVINANPGVPTIISTHNYLTPSGSRDAQGEGLFNNLVRNNSQVFLTLNGHYIGENSLVSTNNRGQPVYQMLADYQGRARGGDGWLRLLTFDPAARQLRVRTYTPVTSGVTTTASTGVGATAPATADLNSQGLLEVDADSQFTIPLDFATRFAPPTPTTTVSFQNGTAGYNGTQDTYLSGDAPTTNYGNDTGLWIDALSTAQPTHGLIKFDNLFGPGAIPADKDIVSARIRLNVAGSNGAGSGFLVHRMTRDWTESSTWNSLTAGVSANGLEALPASTSQTGVNADAVGVPLGFVEIDITADVRAWMNGAPNFGLALLPFTAGVNGIRVDSSEAAVVTDRPQLIVDTTRDAVTVRRFRDGLNGYAGTRDTELRSSLNQQRADRGASANHRRRPSTAPLRQHRRQRLNPSPGRRERHLRPAQAQRQRHR